MTAESATHSNDLALHGSLWLTVGGANLGGHGRMALLRAIAEHGSITRAAKAFGMSYKAAWDAVDTMNNVAGEPLVVRSTGGRGGGATTLTARGVQLVERFAQLDALHQRFVRMLDAEAIDLTHDINLLRMLDMKTSARNQFVGTVTAVTRGAVNDEVTLALPGGACISAIITHESTASLGLQPGITAFALVKASSVIVATGDDDVRLSARNRLRGTIAAITPGAVNAEVVITLDGGSNIAAIVTQASVAELDLSAGVQATAIFKASSVIVGVNA